MSSWSQRRHDATSAEMDAASNVENGNLQDPVNFMQAMADWQTQTMESLTNDAKEYGDMMNRCIESVVYKEMLAAEETIEKSTAQKSRRTSKRQELTAA